MAVAMCAEGTIVDLFVFPQKAKIEDEGTPFKCPAAEDSTYEVLTFLSRELSFPQASHGVSIREQWC